MKRNSLLKKILSVAFATVIVFTVSVREVHYLFSHSHQETHEHCENHLHDSSHHSNCFVCKFDVSFFTDNIPNPQIGEQFFFRNSFAFSYQSVTLRTEISSISLRGPPRFA